MAYKEEVASDDFWAGLPEYESFTAAIDDLGANKPFLLTENNLHGWPYRGVYVTPFLES